MMNIIFCFSYHTHIQQIVAQERRLSGSVSRTMAAMSLGFIVMVTPWTIQEIVAACTGSKVNTKIRNTLLIFSFDFPAVFPYEKSTFSAYLKSVFCILHFRNRFHHF